MALVFYNARGMRLLLDFSVTQPKSQSDLFLFH